MPEPAAPGSPVKHGLAAGDAGRPERADWTIDQGWSHYTGLHHTAG